MKLTAEFENLMDLKEFVKAWAPAFQTESVAPPAAPVQQPVQTAPVQQPVQQTAPVQQLVQTVPVQPQPQQLVPQATIPTTTITYSLDDLARAAMSLMDTGRQADLLLMLSRFGVQSLPELPPAQYGAFATELRTMGAQI